MLHLKSLLKKKKSLYRMFWVPEHHTHIRAESYSVSKIGSEYMVKFISDKHLVCTIFCTTVPNVYTDTDMYPRIRKDSQND